MNRTQNSKGLDTIEPQIDWRRRYFVPYHIATIKNHDEILEYKECSKAPVQIILVTTQILMVAAITCFSCLNGVRM